MKCDKCHKECRKIAGTHHYTESGLDNVWLLNMPMYECNCGHKIFEIPAFMQLHDALAKLIVEKPLDLTREEVKFLRKTLHKSSKELASLLEVSPVTVSRWESGKSKISHAYQLLLKTIVYTHFKHLIVENALEQMKKEREKIERQIKKKTIELPLPFIAHKALLRYRYANA